MLSSRLFLIGATNTDEIFFVDWLIHLIPFITCCHPLVMLKSRLSFEEQPRILDPITTKCYKSFIHHTLLKYQ